MSRTHDLAALDLNLLPVLDSLLATTSVSESARQLGRTQSGLSHALNRLRDLFDDALLVRTGNHMALTPLAEALQAPTREAMVTLGTVLARRSFVPEESTRHVHIGASDYAGAVIVPALLAHLSTAAPQMRLSVHAVGDRVDELVRDGQLDLALGSRFRSLGGVYRRVLSRDRFVVVIPDAHPLAARDRISVDDYCDCLHVLVSPRGQPGSTVDRALAALGKKRDHVLTTSSFLLALYTLRGSSTMICTLPKLLVDMLADDLSLRVVEPPSELELPDIDLTMIYGQLRIDDAAQIWLREQIVQVWNR